MANSRLDVLDVRSEDQRRPDRRSGGSRNAGSGLAGSGLAGSGLAGSGLSGSENVGSGVGASVNAGSCNAGSGHAGSGHAGAGHAGSGSASSNGDGTPGPHGQGGPAARPRLPAQPAVSVVVPTCGRADLLGRCLDALLSQDLPAGQAEIIVVDDQPAQRTYALVNSLAERARAAGTALSYAANRGRHGPAAARNIGWRRARAAIVAFTDDDTMPSHGWLRHGLAAFGPDVDAVCGPVLMPIPPVPTDYERDASQLQSAEFVTANCFCRRASLEALGGFDERFRRAWREDSDLHFRLIKADAVIAQAPQAVVVHPVRPAPWGVSLSQVSKIAFDALLYKKHPGLYRSRIRATPRWDYYATVSALLVSVGALAAGSLWLGLAAGALWLALTWRLFLRRLRGTSRAWSHVAELALTSVLIPPLAVFWRLVGALRYRVRFV